MSSYSKLIVAALDDEVKAIKSCLEIDRTLHFKPATLYQGTWGDHEISLLVTGMGAARMAEGLQKLEGFLAPSSVCHIGYAGSCSPLAGTGKILVTHTIKDQQTGKTWTSPPDQTQLAEKICNDLALLFEKGNLLTVPEVVTDPMEKAALGAEENILALDMESAVVAEWATEKQIPFCITRAILDSLEMQLPPFDTASQNPQPGFGALMQMLTHHPEEALKIPQLQYCATSARNALTKFASGWIQHD